MNFPCCVPWLVTSPSLHCSLDKSLSFIWRQVVGRLSGGSANANGNGRSSKASNRSLPVSNLRDLTQKLRGSKLDNRLSRTSPTQTPMFLGMCWPTGEVLAWGAAMLESVPVSDERAEWAAAME